MDIYSMFSKYRPDRPPVCAFLSAKTPADLEILQQLKPTRLLWGTLGAGVAGLPLITRELAGTRPWSRGMPEREFIAWCDARSIKVFGVVWEVQGYDRILAGIDPKDGDLSSLFVVKNGAKRGRWGLDAFFKDQYPNIGRWGDFFDWHITYPDGSQGTSLVEETACRNILGWKPWALWMVPHLRGHYSTYAQCRNSPFWRNYLKRIIEIQLDCGVHGIQLDESAIPIDAMWCGTGYCKYCMRGVKDYITRHHSQEELTARKLFPDTNLRRYFLRKGLDFLRAHLLVKYFPFWRDFREAHYHMAQSTFRELVQHTKAYGAKRGRIPEVTGNFFGGIPFYLPLIPYVDFVTFEQEFMKPATDHNHFFYRLFQSFGKEAAGVPAVTSAFIMRRRKKENVLKAFIYEAAAVGGHFMVPYSCYTVIDKPYYPPIPPMQEAFEHLRTHEEFITGPQKGEICLAISFPSHLWSYSYLHQALFGTSPYLRRVHSIARLLAHQGITYSVLVLGDGELLPEFVSDPREKSTIILLDAFSLTEGQVAQCVDLARQERAIVCGKCGTMDEHLEPRPVNPLEKYTVDWKMARRMIARVPLSFKIQPFASQAVGFVASNKRGHEAILLANLEFNYRRDQFKRRPVSIRVPGKSLSVHLLDGTQVRGTSRVGFPLSEFAIIELD